MNPMKIYIGGPCSEIYRGAPKAGGKFRWVEMQTLDFDLTNKAGTTVALARVPNTTGSVKSSDEDGYAEVGVVGYFQLEELNKARLFASTTSYLAKSNFSFNKNKFLLDKTTSKSITLCVKQCCDTIPDAGCSCNSTCPTSKIAVSPGDFKYSVLAAAYSISSSNSWTTAVTNYGSGSPKQLEGNMYVYQGIDFTNMGADKVTVYPPNGSTTATYKTMEVCNLAKVENCTAYKVSKITVEASDWDGVTYQFPQSFNSGEWTRLTGDYSGTPGMTRKAIIECVKPTAASLMTLMSMSATKAANAKVLLLRYTLNVTGITGTETSGQYFVYDPTVKTTAATKKEEDAKKDAAQVAGGRLAAEPAFVFMLALYSAVVSKSL